MKDTWYISDSSSLMPETRLNECPPTEREKRENKERAERWAAERKGKCPNSMGISDMDFLCEKPKGHSGPCRRHVNEGKLLWRTKRWGVK